jgi:hypothetical protein
MMHRLSRCKIVHLHFNVFISFNVYISLVLPMNMKCLLLTLTFLAFEISKPDERKVFIKHEKCWYAVTFCVLNQKNFACNIISFNILEASKCVELLNLFSTS